jgi:hypothetical protein
MSLDLIWFAYVAAYFIRITRQNGIREDWLFSHYEVQVKCAYNFSHFIYESLDYVKNIYLFDACFFKKLNSRQAQFKTGRIKHLFFSTPYAR